MCLKYIYGCSCCNWYSTSSRKTCPHPHLHSSPFPQPGPLRRSFCCGPPKSPTDAVRQNWRLIHFTMVPNMYHNICGGARPQNKVGPRNKVDPGNKVGPPINIYIYTYTHLYIHAFSFFVFCMSIRIRVYRFHHRLWGIGTSPWP